jgi:hypothetical protein
MYVLASAILNDGASPESVKDSMTRDEVGPRGTWKEWADLAEDQRQLPLEAWGVLQAEGIQKGDFGGILTSSSSQTYFRDRKIEGS